MSTLLNLGQTPITPGTYNYGPYAAVTNGQPVTALLTPTVWPASDHVFDWLVTWGDGATCGASGIPGSAALPKLKDGTTVGLKFTLQNDARGNATVKLTVYQGFTASLLVTSP
jgi:hypothetical protein